MGRDGRNQSALADSRLLLTSRGLAVTGNPNEPHWYADECTSTKGGALREVTSRIFISEGVDETRVPRGAVIMLDERRTVELDAFYDQHYPGQLKLGPFGNVYRSGLFSLGRGLTKIGDKTTRYDLQNAQTAHRLLDHMLLASYTLNTGDAEAVTRYEADLLAIADRFTTRGSSLKTMIREYIREMRVMDTLDRMNVERLPLMFMRAKDLVRKLMKKLAGRRKAVDEDRDAVMDLAEALIMDADGFRLIASQAIHSTALLVDTGCVDNKDNAVIIWRNYAETLQNAVALPFRLWFHQAGAYFDRAADELEKDDMSGLNAAKQALLAAEACLKVPRIMGTLDAVLLHVSRAREFGGDHMTLLKGNAADLAIALQEVGDELVGIESVLTGMANRRAAKAVSETVNRLADAYIVLMAPFYGQPDQIAYIYRSLHTAERALLLAD